jgi:hypothetical protein
VFWPDDLFDYMDGNAEGYLLYRFARMDGVTCRSGNERLVIDVSEMADHEFAYGIFCATRDARRPIEPIGMGGQVTPSRAAFVKDRFYVEIAAHADKDHSPVLRAFAKAIEKSISGRATAPVALGWFPKEALVADSVRLVPESVLGVRLMPSGYVGRYDVGEAFVVTEASADAAVTLVAGLKARWGASRTTSVPGSDEAFSARDRYLGGLLVFRKGARVAGIAKLAEGIDATDLAGRLARQLP